MDYDDFWWRTYADEGAPGSVAAGYDSQEVADFSCAVVEAVHAARDVAVGPELAGVGVAAEEEVTAGVGGLADAPGFVVDDELEIRCGHFGDFFRKVIGVVIHAREEQLVFDEELLVAQGADATFIQGFSLRIEVLAIVIMVAEDGDNA